MENMEEQDIKEAKRARNFIWMAACDYDIEPLFLAFAPDGSADIYLNFDYWAWNTSGMSMTR